MTARELAATAVVPRGETIFVPAIWARDVVTRSRAMGTARRTVVIMQFCSRRHGTPFTSFSTGERRHTKYIMRIVVTVSLITVPSAAPATPMPTPKMVRSIPSRVTTRVGKMKKALNTTFMQHMRMLRALGVFMSPLHWSILPPACRRSTTGRPQP